MLVSQNTVFSLKDSSLSFTLQFPIAQGPYLSDVSLVHDKAVYQGSNLCRFSLSDAVHGEAFSAAALWLCDIALQQPVTSFVFNMGAQGASGF